MSRKLRTLAALEIGVVMVIALAAVGIRGDDVALAQDGSGTPVNVNAYGCIVLNGGHVTRPAGSRIVVRSGWATANRGSVLSFLEAQTTLLSVQDGRMLDVSDGYGPIEPDQFGAVSLIHRDTGVVLHEPGDSMRFTFTLLFDRRLTDPSDVDFDGVPDPLNGGVGLNFGGTCTVTAT